MAIHVDISAGSRDLIAPLRTALRGSVPVIEGRYSADIEFLGYTALGPMPIGVEFKRTATGDIFTSMTDGRLYGTQLPMMVFAYPWVRYLLIEGALRRSKKDGVLESQAYPGAKWGPAYSRNGEGWTWREYHNRLRSIGEFFSEPHLPPGSGRTECAHTYDRDETIAWIVDLYHYWQKPYDDHTSARQWDRSRDDLLRTQNPLTRTRDIPLARLWANDIEGIGPHMSAYVAAHFKSARALALATEEQWLEVAWQDRSRRRTYHFSKDTVRKIMRQIEAERF